MKLKTIHVIKGHVIRICSYMQEQWLSGVSGKRPFGPCLRNTYLPIIEINFGENTANKLPSRDCISQPSRAHTGGLGFHNKLKTA